jgi:hypothetical protein
MNTTNIIPRKSALPAALILLATLATFFTGWLWAQFPGPFATPTTPDTQRSFKKAVQAQVGWLQSSTRTAPSYATGGADLVWQQFQSVRGAYNNFKTSLTPQQVQYGANDLAELDAGLDIIQEAFTGYQNDLASGRSASTALRSLCQVLNQAAGFWLQEFNKDCARMRAG